MSVDAPTVLQSRSRVNSPSRYRDVNAFERQLARDRLPNPPAAARNQRSLAIQFKIHLSSFVFLPLRVASRTQPAGPTPARR